MRYPPRVIHIQRWGPRAWQVQAQDPTSNQWVDVSAATPELAYQQACTLLGHPPVETLWQGLAAHLDLPESAHLIPHQWTLPTHLTLEEVLDRLGLTPSNDGGVGLLTMPDGRAFFFGKVELGGQVAHTLLDPIWPEVLLTSTPNGLVLHLDAFHMIWHHQPATTAERQAWLEVRQQTLNEINGQLSPLGLEFTVKGHPALQFVELVDQQDGKRLQGSLDGPYRIKTGIGDFEWLLHETRLSFSPVAPSGEDRGASTFSSPMPKLLTVSQEVPPLAAGTAPLTDFPSWTVADSAETEGADVEQTQGTPDA